MPGKAGAPSLVTTMKPPLPPALTPLPSRMTEGGDFAKMTYLTELFAAIRRREEGQTMAEYGVILAVITVLIIGALLLLSSGIERNIMSVVNVL